jgi:site-specific DNA-methyltransferase (adenine-specific)
VEVNRIVLGDCQQVLTEVIDGSVDQIVTDPPYGYSFMGKDWDKAVPKVAIWKECLRVLKPGAFAFVMSSPRADVLSRMIVNLSDAGFRTDFTPIYWAYASGFPKSENIALTLDRRACLKEFIQKFGRKPIIDKAKKIDEFRDYWKIWMPTYPKYIPLTLEAKQLIGSFGGCQLKPAVEVIIVAMKPLNMKSFVNQALSNGKGVTWLDNARIPFEEGGSIAENPLKRKQSGAKINYGVDSNPSAYTLKSEPGEMNIDERGRFPAHLLVSDDILNDGKTRKSGTIEPHHLIDKQKTTEIYGEYTNLPAGEQTTYGDSGDFSRYFSLDAWFSKTIKKLPAEVQQTFPFLIEPKASKSERNKNLERLDNGTFLDESRHDKNAIGCNNPRNRTGKLRSGNVHPTVKPLDLMTYLITLGSRSNDLILDPFCGSGTTCLAAKMLGRRFIGIEVKEEYVKLAETRVHSHKTLFEFGTPEIMLFNSEKSKNV